MVTARNNVKATGPCHDATVMQNRLMVSRRWGTKPMDNASDRPGGHLFGAVSLDGFHRNRQTAVVDVVAAVSLEGSIEAFPEYGRPGIPIGGRVDGGAETYEPGTRFGAQIPSAGMGKPDGGSFERRP